MIQALVNGNWESFSDGELQPGTDSFNFKSGLYETFRTKNHKPIFLKPHLDRLFNSAKEINLNILYSRSEIEKMIADVIKRFPRNNQRARIIVIPEKVIIYTTDLNLDQNIYQGVSTITVSAIRTNPKIKSTSYRTCHDAYNTAHSNGCFDAILLDESDTVLEGSRSNVFWVLDNTLYTRNENILPGITRQTIISKSPFTVHFGYLNQSDFYHLDELFLTNSGSGIIPVLKVNSTLIGNGELGSITSKLLQLYDIWLNNEL